MSQIKLTENERLFCNRRLAVLTKHKNRQKSIGKRIGIYFSYFEDNKSISGLDKISNKYIFKKDIEKND